MAKAPWVKIDHTQVLKATKDGKLYLFGEQISDIDLRTLQQEARAFKAFKLWRVLRETMKERAIQRGLVDSLNWETTLSAKMMLDVLAQENFIVELLASYAQPAKKK
jgi:hypothetical protein